MIRIYTTWYTKFHGEFIFFLDSDNIVDKQILTELIKVIEEDRKIGVVGPKMYYYKDPKQIWMAGGNINLFTSRTTHIGNEIDNGQFDQVREVGHFANAFLVRREVIEKIGLFDENYFIMYEESDFMLRAKRAGYKIIYAPTAKLWHDIIVPEDNSNPLRKLSLFTKQRAYFTARNRILFMRKNMPSAPLLLCPYLRALKIRLKMKPFKRAWKIMYLLSILLKIRVIPTPMP